MADAEEKRTLAELETEVDEEGDGKALVRATSTIFGGRTEARATKKFLSSKKRVEFYVWARDLPYAPGSTIPIQGTPFCPLGPANLCARCRFNRSFSNGLIFV